MGNGIMGNVELIEALINACEDAVKALHAGNHILFCKIMYGMVVRLAELKDGVKNDIDSRNQTIETLKEQLRNSGREVVDIDLEKLAADAEKDGADDGGN